MTRQQSRLNRAKKLLTECGFQPCLSPHGLFKLGVSHFDVYVQPPDALRTNWGVGSWCIKVRNLKDPSETESKFFGCLSGTTSFHGDSAPLRVIGVVLDQIVWNSKVHAMEATKAGIKKVLDPVVEALRNISV
jgi:hypothetical protein